MKITQSSVGTVTAPPGKPDHVFWDDAMPGFGLRLRGDTRRFIIQYRIGKQQRRESLGDIRKVKLEDARRIARQRFASIELGVDPGATKIAARAEAAVVRLTLGTIADRYLQARHALMRPSTYRAASRYFRHHWAPLCSRPIATVTRADIAARLQELVAENGPVAAARARGNLSALFAWALREGLYEGANVVAGTNNPDPKTKRERVLSAAEIKIVWDSCRDEFGAIVKLLILTGARGSEIGGLKWEDIHFDTGTLMIPGSRTKNHKVLELPLPAMAIDILHTVPRRADNEHLFGGTAGYTSWSTAKAQLDARITVAEEGRLLAPWALHDIRRSTATGMAELGVLPHTIEAVLNHTGFRAGVAGVYNRASYMNEKRTALALWADHVAGILEGRDRKVVALKIG